MNKSTPAKQVHPFEPVFDKSSKILILGSFPSVKSRETSFYYGHPQNRFWKVLSAVFSDKLPLTNDEKKSFLLKHNIALWDSIASCEITGSSDTSIKDAVPNDIEALLSKTSISRIYTNGTASGKIYEKYIFPEAHIKSIPLPSTSPANAKYTLDKLVEEWSVIAKEY